MLGRFFMKNIIFLKPKKLIFVLSLLVLQKRKLVSLALNLRKRWGKFLQISFFGKKGIRSQSIRRSFHCLNKVLSVDIYLYLNHLFSFVYLKNLSNYTSCPYIKAIMEINDQTHKKIIYSSPFRPFSRISSAA